MNTTYNNAKEHTQPESITNSVISPKQNAFVCINVLSGHGSESFAAFLNEVI